MKKNVLFTTTVFSIDEKDGLNVARFERTFIAALERMYLFGGMYVWPNRKLEYLSTRRVMVNAENVPKIVFGDPYSYPQAVKNFNRSCLGFISEQEEENEQARCVYNSRINRIMPVSAEDIVLSENVLRRFLGQKGPGLSKEKKEIIFVDYSFQLGIGNGLKPVPYKENFQHQVKEFLVDAGIDYIKVNEIKYFSDGTFGVTGKSPRYLYKKYVWVSSEWAVMHFCNNRGMRMFLKQYPADGYIYDAEKDILRTIPGNSYFLSDTVLKNWVKEY